MVLECDMGVIAVFLQLSCFSLGFPSAYRLFGLASFL